MRTALILSALIVALVATVASASSSVPRTTPGMKMGSPTAPIWIEMFVDLQCPDCAVAWPIMKQVIQQVGTNNIYLSLNLVPLWMHRQAGDMTRAAAIVARRSPNSYFKFVDYIFSQQSQFFNAAMFNKTENDLYNMLADVTSHFGVDKSYFFTEMTSDANYAYASFGVSYANRKNVFGTPTYFVNGFLVDFDEDTTVAQWVQFLNKLLSHKEPAAANNAF